MNTQKDAPSKLKRLLKILLIILGLFAAYLVMVNLVTGLILKQAFEDMAGQDHLSDKELLENFYQHQNSFEQLREMIIQDKIIDRIDVDWTSPGASELAAHGITHKKIKDYRKRMEKLGIKRGFSVYGYQGEIKLITSAQGLVTGGSSKGYVYRETEPKPLVDSIDHYRHPNPHSYSIYQKIKPNWYLFYDYDD